MKKLIASIGILFVTSTAFASINVTYSAYGNNEVRVDLTYTDHLVSSGLPTGEHFEIVPGWASASITGFGIQDLTASVANPAEHIVGSYLIPIWNSTDILTGDNNWWYSTLVDPWHSIGSTTDPLPAATAWVDISSWTSQDMRLDDTGGVGIGMYSNTSDVIMNGTISLTFIGDMNALPAPGALALLGLAGITTRKRRK